MSDERRVWGPEDLEVLDEASMAAWLRRSWARVHGAFDADRLCSLIAETAAACGASPVVGRQGEWRTVSAEIDWISTSPSDDRLLLTQFWDVPGVYLSLRPEAFFLPFARSAVASRGPDLTVLKGIAAGCPRGDETFRRRWARAVSFVPVAQ